MSPQQEQAEYNVLGRYDASKYGALRDVQYEHTGRRLATGSDDGVVRIWSVDQRDVISELKGHSCQSSVISLSWAPGGSVPGQTTLASTSSDGQVIIWRESKTGEWVKVESTWTNVSNFAPAVAVEFSPAEYGFILAVAGTDGYVTLLTRKEQAASPGMGSGEQWVSRSFAAHEKDGLIAFCWAPSTSPARLAGGPAAARAPLTGPRRVATAAATGSVCIWKHDDKTSVWSCVQDLGVDADAAKAGLGLSDVRDIAWRPNIGIPASVLATCTQAGDVATWVQDMDGQAWRLQATWKVPGDARRLAWSKAGTVLSVSIGETGSALFKEGPLGHWSELSTFEE